MRKKWIAKCGEYRFFNKYGKELKNEECMKSKTAVHTDGGNTCTEERKIEKGR